MGQMRALDAALMRGATYLNTTQQHTGNFTATSWQRGNPKNSAEAEMPLALAAHLALALGNASSTPLTDVTTRLTGYIRSDCPILATTTRAHKAGTTDIFTLCSALLAVHQQDAANIPATALGQIAQLLVANESTLGGPYYTTTGNNERVIDPACNAVIHRFVSAVAEPLPNLTECLQTVVTKQTYASVHYCNPLAVIHLLAHSAPPPRPELIVRHLRAAYQQGQWHSALEIALGISSMAMLGAHLPEEAVLFLLGQQQADGSWAAAPYYHHPTHPEWEYGSAALTTAFALEALAAYRKRYTETFTPTTPVVNKVEKPLPENDIYEAVTARAHQQIAPLPQPLRQTMEQMVDRVRRADKNQEIILLPLFMAQSLLTPRTFSNEAYIQLGLANLYNWMAYTIYDDFLDDEGEAPLLPVANVALRYSLQAFREALPDDRLFQHIVAGIFDMIDGANAWEVARCRFPVTDSTITIQKLPAYGRRSRLAERSLSHSLPALGILGLAGFDFYDVRVAACHTAFKHYLIARQLNDDMHDWEEDVRAGQISYVVRTILEELHLPRKPIAFDTLIPLMRRQFWNVTLARICNDIMYHTSHGKQALARSKLLNELNIINKLLVNLEGVVAHSLDEQRRANEFLRGYRKKEK